MNIIAVDDERIALETLVDAIKEATPNALISEFRKAQDALDYVMEHPCDVAFLDIEMREISGIELARRIKVMVPRINIVFVTGYSEYASEALKLRASVYVMKPVTKDEILEELDNLRHPVKSQTGTHIWAQTFGNFEIFVGGKPLHFKYNLTKEMLAYLVDRRGAMCTGGELEAVLWEEGNKSSYLRKLKSDLIHTFEDEGCSNAIVVQPGKIGINVDELDSDYFDWHAGKAYALNAYHGEYMSQYSWAEITHSSIEESLKNE